MKIQVLYEYYIKTLSSFYCIHSANELQSEVEDLASKLLYMEDAKEDVRSDISILKRATNKADTESMKAQIEKKRQVY